MRENQGFSICFLTNVSHMITSDLRPSTTTKRKRFLENDTVGNVGNQDKDEKGLYGTFQRDNLIFDQYIKISLK